MCDNGDLIMRVDSAYSVSSVLLGFVNLFRNNARNHRNYESLSPSCSQPGGVHVTADIIHFDENQCQHEISLVSNPDLLTRMNSKLNSIEIRC